jgi:predicted Zn finger-like uncharacterized protein
MIIACPNCGARYRLAATALTQPSRMRCAACGHRWMVDAGDEIPVVVAPQPVAEPAAGAPSATIDEATTDEATTDETPPDEAPSAGSGIARTLVAITLGGALAIAAGALWVARIDPADLPVLGEQISALAPRPLPLQLRFRAHTTQLPAGDRLLEINGSITNTGTATITLPDLEARLATPASTVRRWRIAAPVADLAPGRSVAFSTTATGFPADATIVAIRPAR